MSEWLIDRLRDIVTGWVSDWLIGRVTGLVTHWMTDWQSDIVSDWVSEWLIEWLSGLLIEWLICFDFGLIYFDEPTLYTGVLNKNIQDAEKEKQHNK